MARLDAELVRRGLARSRGRATELVAAGRVRIGGVPARKPSTEVADTDDVVVDGADVVEVVSRGARKLAGALDALAAAQVEQPQVAGARCLDAGASTGGFTQVLLHRGAAHVVAVDVGHGQMDPGLAADPRVTLHEGLNVRDLTPEVVAPAPALVVADLSFISLTLVVPALVAAAAPGAGLLLMVKPQFEVGRERLGSDGVVTSAALREEAVLRVARSLEAARAAVHAVVPSPLPGPAGNVEYFVWATADRPGAPAGADLLDGLAAAVRAAVRDGVVGLTRPPVRGVPRWPA